MVIRVSLSESTHEATNNKQSLKSLTYELVVSYIQTIKLLGPGRTGLDWSSKRAIVQTYANGLGQRPKRLPSRGSLASSCTFHSVDERVCERERGRAGDWPGDLQAGRRAGKARLM